MHVGLTPPFRSALDDVVGELSGRDDVVGILFFGSAARGTARTGSDIDLYAITSADSSGHLGRLVAGVPVEVSFGSVHQMSAQVRQERSTVVNAFATGRLLLDNTAGALAALCAEARVSWERGPGPIAAPAALRFRFHLTDLARDLEAMPERSAETALLASECVRLAIEAFCAREQVWMPSMRHVPEALARTHPGMAAMLEQCAEEGFPASLAVRIADTVLARLGGRLDTYETGPAPPAVR